MATPTTIPIFDLKKPLNPQQTIELIPHCGLTEPTQVKGAPSGTKGSYFQVPYAPVGTPISFVFAPEVDPEYAVYCPSGPVNPQKEKGVDDSNLPVKDKEGKLILGFSLSDELRQKQITTIEDRVFEIFVKNCNDENKWREWFPDNKKVKTFKMNNEEFYRENKFNPIFQPAYEPTDEKKKGTKYDPTAKAKIRVPTQNEQDTLMELIKKLRNPSVRETYDDLAKKIPDPEKRKWFLGLLNSYTKFYLYDGKISNDKIKLIDLGFEWTSIRKQYIKKGCKIIPFGNVGVYWSGKAGPSINLTEVIVFKKEESSRPSVKKDSAYEIQSIDEMQVDETPLKTTAPVPAPPAQPVASQSAPPVHVPTPISMNQPLVSIPAVSDDDPMVDDPMVDDP